MFFRRLFILLFGLTLLVSTLFASQEQNSDLIRYYEVDPSYLISPTNSYPSQIIQHHPRRDPVGEPEQIGSTFWDHQHNGTISKMIAVDRNGGMHAVWMGAGDRDIWNSNGVCFQYRDPETEEWFEDDVLLGLRTRPGNIALLPEDDRTVMFATAFIDSGGFDFHYLPAMWVDFGIGIGRFDFPPPHPDFPSLWSKGSIDRSNRAHMMATENSANNLLNFRVIYWRGESTDRDFQEWEWTEPPIVLGTTAVISSMTSASRQSNKVVLAWHHNRVGAELGPWDEVPGAYQRNNDIRYVVLEDGEEYDPEEHYIHSLTKIFPPDPDNFPGDPIEPEHRDPLNPDAEDAAYGDIWRPYCDIDIQFDPWEDGDDLYATFATCAMWERPFENDEGDIIDGMTGEMGMLWFWNCDEDTITLVANGYYFNRTNNGGNWHSRCGGWRMNADRPSIAFDPDSEGRIFVTWVSFPQIQRLNPEYEDDPENEPPFLYDFEFAGDTCSGGYSNAEIMLSISEDYGITWLEPVNITQTRWDGDEAPEPGECRSEAWQSVAVDAYDGALHVMYIQDTEAGAFVYGGAVTNSPVIYHRVEIEDLNIDELEPLELPYEGFMFHNYPWMGVADDNEGVGNPTEFSISAVYPNPFNSRATLRYSLPRSGDVTLSLLDVTGRILQTQVIGTQAAGKHTLAIDGTDLPAGIYFARLEADGVNRTQKLLLVK